MAKLKLTIDKLNGIAASEILAVHRQFEPKFSLEENIGDGFLVANNPVFSTIREEYIKLGFGFTLQDHSHYASFPLMCLDDIYKQKKIPYFNNRYWLDVLAKKIPNLTLLELKKSEIKFNYLFHESAHFVAHRHLFGRREMNRIPVEKISLLKILIGESFANAVECISAAFCEGEIENYFLDANCHFRVNEKEAKTLRLAIDRIGIEKTFTVLLYSFLYANYLVKNPEKKELGLIHHCSGSSSKEDKLAKIGFQLCDLFRTNTTQLHLMKLGFSRDLNGWLSIDPVKELNRPNCGAVKSSFDALVALATR